MKIKKPCIRGLKRYEKKGCPCAEWDKVDQNGCPFWVSMPIVDPENSTKTKDYWNCADIIAIHQRHAILQLLESNYSMTESLRNGMCENTDKGIRPKSDIASIQLVNLIKNAQQYRMLKE